MSEAPERIWREPDIWFPECEKQYDRIEELEAKLAKATDTLSRIVRGDDDAHNWAIWTLAELKGDEKP